MLRGRIAPTPSGFLHAGNAFSFILTWLIVRQHKGVLRLRIDDLDAPRANREYIEDIFRVLHWLGLDWDEGPQTAQEHIKHFSQQQRADRYAQLIEALIEKEAVFACTCSRTSLATCTCRQRSLPFDTPDSALRIKTQPGLFTSFHDEQLGDVEVNLHDEMREFVVRRKEGIAAYQIATLADDTDHQINFIVRGTDLLHSTAAQLYLAALVNIDGFSKVKFYHHPLLTDEQGNKLSKSAGSASLKSWRGQQRPPAELYAAFCRWMQWDAQVNTLQELSAFYASLCA